MIAALGRALPEGEDEHGDEGQDEEDEQPQCGGRSEPRRHQAASLFRA